MVVPFNTLASHIGVARSIPCIAYSFTYSFIHFLLVIMVVGGIHIIFSGPYSKKPL